MDKNNKNEDTENKICYPIKLENILKVIFAEENSSSSKKIIDKQKNYLSRKSIKKQNTELIKTAFSKMKIFKSLMLTNLNNSNSSLLKSKQLSDINSKKVINVIMTTPKRKNIYKIKSSIINFNINDNNSTKESISPQGMNKSNFLSSSFWKNNVYASFLENIKINEKPKYRLNTKKNYIFRNENLAKQKHFYRNLQNILIIDKLKLNIRILNIFYILLILCIIINFFLSIIDNEIYSEKSISIFEDNNFKFNSIKFVSVIKRNKNYMKVIENRKLTGRENFLRFLNGIFSILSMIFNILIFIMQRKILLMNKDENYKSIHKKLNKKMLVIESFFLLIFYPPYINKVLIGNYNNMIYIYSLNSIFLIITTLKLYFIFKFLLYSSSLNSILGKIVCTSNNIHLSNLLIFRSYLKKYPYIFIVLIFLILVISISIIIYYMEYFLICLDCTTQPEINLLIDNEQITNIMFQLFSFLIGKHNFKSTPRTFSGKILFFVAIYIGIVFIFNFYNNLFQKINFKPEEKKAYSKLKKLFHPENKEHKASNVIRVFLQLYSLHHDYNFNNKIYDEELKEDIYTIYETQENFNSKNLNVINQKKRKLLIKFYEHLFILKLKFVNNIINFENIFKVANNYSIPFDDVLNKVGEKMRSNTTLLNKELDVIFEIDKKLNNLIINQKKSLMKCRSVINYNTELMDYLLKKHNDKISDKSSRNFKKIIPKIKKKSFFIGSNKTIKINIPIMEENKVLMSGKINNHRKSESIKITFEIK